MHEGTTEERFEAAARNLCERWSTFDFVRSVESVDSTLPDRLDPDHREFVPHWAESLYRNFDNIGAVAAIKRQLHTESEGDALLDLAASNRLDLTVEFLALRPAWKSLFDETERRTAAERLLKLLALSFPDGTAPSAVDDLDHILDWLIGKIARWEVDPWLPKSREPLGCQGLSSRKDQTWCESVADTARGFSEIGLIATSLAQCIHYLHCQQCIGAFPELERQFRRFETRTIRQCHELLKLLRVCIERALSQGESDAFVWRAIVCGAGLFYNDSVGEFSRVLEEVGRGCVPAPALRRLLFDLNQDELHLLSFVDATSWVFIEMQWSLYDNDDLIYLPSDGDLWDIPGVVVVLNAPDVDEWKRLMTGSDLAFPKRCRDGRDETLPIEGYGLFRVISATAELRSGKWVAALAAIGQEPVPEARAVEATKEERPAAPEVESARPPVSGSREDSRMRILLDRMTELRDLVASNSAAQVPIIDTLQAVVNKIDNPSRYRAEESLRRELGDVLYEWLSPKARHLAVAAEYCWLDTNEPNPSKIVADLATAFEHQLRETVFTRFCQRLLASGIRNYPERPEPLPSLVSGSPSARPHPGLPVRDGSGPEKLDVPTLLKDGRIARLTLGSMQKALQWPLPALTNFLARRQVQIRELMKVLPEVTRERNRAVHEGQPVLREEASNIRRLWLGKTRDFPNIFSVLVPDNPARSATTARR
jgi:hypothetical protein